MSDMRYKQFFSTCGGRNKYMTRCGTNNNVRWVALEYLEQSGVSLLQIQTFTIFTHSINPLKPNDPLMSHTVRYLNWPHVLTSPYGVANICGILKDFVHSYILDSYAVALVGPLNVKAALWCDSFFPSCLLSFPPKLLRLLFQHFSELRHVSAEL